MSDIVEILRKHRRGPIGGAYLRKAANEIERLRGLLREVRARFPAGFHDAELMDRISAALAGTADQLHWSSGDPSVTITPQGEMSVDPQCPACGRSTKRHPGYIIGNHWLGSAYERICAGEAEDDVLRDYDVVRVTNQPSVCLACDGSGDGSKDMDEQTVCQTCKGTGDLYNGPTVVACDDCEGTGLVPPQHPRAAVLGEVVAERIRQDAKWGGPNHDDQHTANDFWGFIRERLNGGEREFIQVAALAVAAVESVRRKRSTK